MNWSHAGTAIRKCHLFSYIEWKQIKTRTICLFPCVCETVSVSVSALFMMSGHKSCFQSAKSGWWVHMTHFVIIRKFCPKCNDYTENVIFAQRLEIRGRDGNCMHWTVHLTLQGMHLYIFETTLDAQIQTMLYTDQKMCYILRLCSSRCVFCII